jgi:dienelactone hydrolase
MRSVSGVTDHSYGLPIARGMSMEAAQRQHSEIDEVTDATRANRNVEIHLYPGAGHGFFNPLRPVYDAAAVALARQRIDGLLDRLKESP